MHQLTFLPKLFNDQFASPVIARIFGDLVSFETFPVRLSKITVGDMLLIGRFPGWIKLAGDGAILKAFGTPGVEKSSISLFHTIPSFGETLSAPNLEIILNQLVTAIIYFFEIYLILFVQDLEEVFKLLINAAIAIASNFM